MSKGGSGDGLGLIFTFILVLTIIALWFIKWLLIAVALVICAIVGIVKLCNKKKSVNVYETKNYQIENEDDELIIEDDNLFDKRIRQRGMEYYKQYRVGDLKEKGKEYSSIVQGEQDYKVSIIFDKNERIKSASCTCPYYMDGFKNCKHIYATLLKIKFKPICISDSFPLKIMNDEIENNKEAKLDKEYKNYGLSEGEIEVVKKGIYKKWDFEEEEMDEDSYYYEDDTGKIDDSDDNDEEE